MKYILLIISIPALLCMNSCHNSKGEENNSPSAVDIFQSDEAGEITISREQFESMHMKIGDPAPMLFSNQISANGYIMASPTGSAQISTMIAGRVRRIHFSSGDFVRSGELLFSLESSEVILMQQTYADLFQRLKLLKADYERMQVLNDERIAAQKDFLKAESEYRSLYIEVEGMRARLKMINIDPAIIENGDIVPFLSVKAPISGTITRQKLVLGQHLEPDETAMELVNEDHLRLRLELFEKSISELEAGQQVLFSLPDLSGQKFEAVLSHIGKSVSRESRTVECFAEIRETDKKLLLDNMYVETTIVTCEREALAIPEEALIREADRDFVLILISEKDDQMTFRKVPVPTGVTRQGHTEILDENITSILLNGVYSLGTDE